MFLAEKTVSKCLQLEQAIEGKRKFREFIAPILMTVWCTGCVVLLGLTNKDVSLIVTFSSFLLLLSVWNGFETEAIKKQIAALKEYVDFRVAEIASQSKN